jgi:hypothetical protein
LTCKHIIIIIIIVVPGVSKNKRAIKRSEEKKANPEVVGSRPTDGQYVYCSSYNTPFPHLLISAVLDEPKINTCRSPEVKSDEENEERPWRHFDSWPLGTRHGLHHRSVRITDVETESDRSKYPAKVLAQLMNARKRRNTSGLASR